MQEAGRPAESNAQRHTLCAPRSRILDFASIRPGPHERSANRQDGRLDGQEGSNDGQGYM